MSKYNYQVVNLVNGKFIAQTDYDSACNRAKENSYGQFIGVIKRNPRKIIDIYLNGMRYHIEEQSKK